MHPKIGIGVVVRKNGKILIQKRLKKESYGQWAFPGGHLEVSESIVAGGLRELAEETGIVANDACVLGWTEEVSVGRHYITFFLLLDTEQEPQHLEPDKGEMWQWVSQNEIPQPLMQATINGLEKFSVDIWVFSEKN